MASASDYYRISEDSVHLPRAIEWDEFIRHIRSNVAPPTPYLEHTSRCGNPKCDEKYASYLPPTPTPTPVATTVKSSEQTMFDFIAGNYYGMRDRIVEVTYVAYKRWVGRQSDEFKASKTPYDLMTYYIANPKTTELGQLADPAKRYDRIITLQKFFPRRSLMEIKEIIYPLYMKWSETAVFPPKTNRWQKMKAFATEYGSMA